jgi:hypothetical protein
VRIRSWRRRWKWTRALDEVGVVVGNECLRMSSTCDALLVGQSISKQLSTNVRTTNTHRVAENTLYLEKVKDMTGTFPLTILQQKLTLTTLICYCFSPTDSTLCHTSKLNLRPLRTLNSHRNHTLNMRRRLSKREIILARINLPLLLRLIKVRKVLERKFQLHALVLTRFN